ncbi:DDE superfamily endonuclease [Ceratobasidium sp. AG-Ba]|nr:DDE superfamily endonuclease [Ceratobasidium sp. AG-Ba]
MSRRVHTAIILFLVYLINSGRGSRKRKRVQHTLLRCDLMPNPRLGSDWVILHQGRRDGAYIKVMGIDVATFNYILDSGFKEAWMRNTITRDDVNPAGRSRPGARSLDAAGGLGVILYHLCSVMSDAAIEQIFALVPSSVSRYLSFGMPLLLEVLKKLPESQIEWPSVDDMGELSDIVNTRYPSIKGMIIAATINAPGSWHDVRVASVDIYDLLLDETPEGYRVLADSAFQSNNENLAKKIHTPLKRNNIFPGLNPEQVNDEWEYSAVVTSARQAVEWGMRAVQGSFARLRIPLSANDSHGRQLLIESCLRLHNLRTTRVGINQIRTVYLPYWTCGEPTYFERLYATLFPLATDRNPRAGPFNGLDESVP